MERRIGRYARRLEGKKVVVDDTTKQTSLEVSTDTDVKSVPAEDKDNFEAFKEMYKGLIDDKVKADYGDVEDKGLWEDTAKEMFIQQDKYIVTENKEVKTETTENIVKMKFECQDCGEVFYHTSTNVSQEELDELEARDGSDYECPECGSEYTIMTGYKYLDKFPSIKENKEVKTEARLTDYLGIMEIRDLLMQNNLLLRDDKTEKEFAILDDMKVEIGTGDDTKVYKATKNTNDEWELLEENKEVKTEAEEKIYLDSKLASKFEKELNIEIKSFSNVKGAYKSVDKLVDEIYENRDGLKAKSDIGAILSAAKIDVKNIPNVLTTQEGYNLALAVRAVLEGYLEPEDLYEKKTEAEDKEVWYKIEKIVDHADKDLGPDESGEYEYNDKIKFVIYRDAENEELFSVYTYVNGEVQEDLDTGDVHISDMDKTLVEIVNKLASGKITEATEEIPEGTANIELHTDLLPIINMYQYDIYNALSDIVDLKSEDVDEIMLNIAKPIIEDEIKEVLPGASITFGEYSHPQYYRAFSNLNDTLDFTINYDITEYEALKEKAINDPQFEHYLKNNYSSYDGFASYMADNIEDFKTEEDWKQFVSVLSFYLPNDWKENNGTLELETIEQIYESGYDTIDSAIDGANCDIVSKVNEGTMELSKEAITEYINNLYADSDSKEEILDGVLEHFDLDECKSIGKKVKKQNKPEETKKVEEDKHIIPTEELPDACYVYVASTNEIGVVKKGEIGYYPTTIPGPESHKLEDGEKIVKDLNDELGVTEEQAISMSLKSMYGWDNPKTEKEETKKVETKVLKEDKYSDNTWYTYNIDGEEYNFICRSWENGRNWGHEVELKSGRSAMSYARCVYYNRTWESFQYQSCMLEAVRKVIENIKSGAIEELRNITGKTRLSAQEKEASYKDNKNYNKMQKLYNAVRDGKPEEVKNESKEIKTEASMDIDEVAVEYKEAYGKELDLNHVNCVIARDKMLSGWGGAEGKTHYQVVLCGSSMEAANIAYNMKRDAEREQLANVRVDYKALKPTSTKSVAYCVGKNASAWN